jgi:hypothetical protein
MSEEQILTSSTILWVTLCAIATIGYISQCLEILDGQFNSLSWWEKVGISLIVVSGVYLLVYLLIYPIVRYI